MGKWTKSPHSRPSRRRATADEVDVPTRLADALFTTTQQRVLALLFGQPARSYFASELIELTGSGSGAVQRELKKLASSGLVTIQRIGKQKHYRANPDSPIFAELCAIARKTVALVEPIREALAPLAGRIRLAFIYGSVAKGTDTARSDVDVFVVADRLTLEMLYSALAPVEASLDRRINPTLYTGREFDTRRAAGHPFLARVLEGEHLVLIGSADGTAGARQPGPDRPSQAGAGRGVRDPGPAPVRRKAPRRR
jgi:predicted nucleotidyltransferase